MKLMLISIVMLLCSFSSVDARAEGGVARDGESDTTQLYRLLDRLCDVLLGEPTLDNAAASIGTRGTGRSMAADGTEQITIGGMLRSVETVRLTTAPTRNAVDKTIRRIDVDLSGSSHITLQSLTRRALGGGVSDPFVTRTHSSLMTWRVQPERTDSSDTKDGPRGSGVKRGPARTQPGRICELTALFPTVDIDHVREDLTVVSRIQLGLGVLRSTPAAR